MAYQILLNDSLKDFVKKLDINQEQKDSLLSRIPQLDKLQRLKLLTILGDIYILNLEEKETTEKLKASWQL